MVAVPRMLASRTARINVNPVWTGIARYGDVMEITIPGPILGVGVILNKAQPPPRATSSPPDAHDKIPEDRYTTVQRVNSTLNMIAGIVNAIGQWIHFCAINISAIKFTSP